MPCDISTLQTQACASGIGQLDNKIQLLQLIAQLTCEASEGGGGGAVWGDITGTLSNQADLQAALNAKGYTIPFMGGWESGIQPDSTIQYFGGDLYNSTRTGVTTYANMSVKVPASGTLVAFYLKVRISTVGTGESVPHYLRINDSTDAGPISLPYNAVTGESLLSGLSQAVTAGDNIALKVDNPAFVGNPQGVRYYALAYII